MAFIWFPDPFMAFIFMAFPRTERILCYEFWWWGECGQMSLDVFVMNTARLAFGNASHDSFELSSRMVSGLAEHIRLPSKFVGKIRFWPILNFGLFSPCAHKLLSKKVRLKNNEAKFRKTEFFQHFSAIYGQDVIGINRKYRLVFELSWLCDRLISFRARILWHPLVFDVLWIDC